MSAEARENRPILFLGSVSFRSLRQRSQQLALALSRRTAIVYVDPPRSRLGRLSIPETRVEDLPAGPGSFELLVPPPAFPFSGYLPLVNRFNYAATARFLRCRAVTPRAIVVSYPKHFDLLAAFPLVPVCYDVMDDYPLFHNRWQGAVIARLHRRMLRRADAVVVTSRKLEERCRPFARRIALLPNAVDPAFHEDCARVAPDAAVLRLPVPRIGFAGALTPWIDFDLVASLARTFPRGSLVLVGPTIRQVPALPANVHLLGMRPHAALPAVLRAFDVGIVPFRPSPLTDAVRATKIYEYLSAGIPVVSSDLDGSACFGELVARCRTLDDWQAALARALSLRPESARADRRAFASENLWPDRAATLLALVEELEGRRGGAG